MRSMDFKWTLMGLKKINIEIWSDLKRKWNDTLNMKLKLASRWPQITVLMSESFNHTFDWFIQTKQATVFMNESLNHWLAWFVQWGPHLIRQWLVTGHIYAAFKNQSDGKLTLDSDIQCPPLILAPLINISKGGCENKSALFILLIFHSKNSQNSNLSLK